MSVYCDYCNKKIKEDETYYTIHQHNIMICGDTIADICCDCAEKKLLVDLDLFRMNSNLDQMLLQPFDNKRIEKIINPLQVQYSEKL